MRAGVVNGGIPGAVATGSSGGSRSRSDFPSPSQCHVCRLRLTLPHQNLRDKMRPLEVVRSRRGARVDESTCLESMRLGNGTVGSNPTLSAIEQRHARVEKACELELPSRTDAVGFERGRSRGRGSPACGGTRGRAPSVGACERDFECPPSPPNRASSIASHSMTLGERRRSFSVTGPGPVQQNPVNPARSGRKQR